MHLKQNLKCDCTKVYFLNEEKDFALCSVLLQLNLIRKLEKKYLKFGTLRTFSLLKKFTK